MLCYHIHTSKYKNSNSLKRHTTIFWNKGKYYIVIYTNDIILLIWSSMSSIFLMETNIFSEMNQMVNEMVSAVDDGDGEIDYDEFVSMIQKY